MRDGTRGLRVRTWHPNVAGRFPVVVFSHGLNGRPEDFDPLLTRWAAAGFVVIAPAYPYTARENGELRIGDVVNQPADASYVLTRALAGPIKSRLDGNRVAAAGHSAGGITTVGLFASARDPRLRAGIVFAGNGLGISGGFTGSPASLLFVHGDADAIVSYSSGKAAYDRAPWPKAMLTLSRQGHGEPFLVPNSPAYPAVAATTLDFLRWTLYGDPAARKRIATDAKSWTLDDRLEGGSPS